MDREDGQIFIKNLAYFVRTHEKALANALLVQRHAPKNGKIASAPNLPGSPGAAPPSSTSFLPLPFSFGSASVKPAKLSLTPHHLYYLLVRFEELGISVGAMNVRLENIHTDTSPTNYVSFLNQSSHRGVRGSDRDSIHSVSSVRSVMSSMTSLWSGFGLSTNSAAKSEKLKMIEKEDMRYLYSAFTKIPCLRLAPDHKAPLISGYEEFPFDTAVPLFAFKNLTALEIVDVDFRQFYGWDRVADQVRSLVVKRAAVDDTNDLILNVVLDDMDKRRRRSAKSSSPIIPMSASSLSSRPSETSRSDSGAESPISSERRYSLGSPQALSLVRTGSAASKAQPRQRQRSNSPSRPASSRHSSNLSHGRPVPRIRRSSGSSGSSVKTNTPRGSQSNLLAGLLPPTKWRFLRHLSLADNGLTSISPLSLVPLASTLLSLDLSSNLFSEVPDSLASLTALRALNLSQCMISSLHSLVRSPLPAINAINLRANRLTSLAGIERLPSLERIDLRDNKLSDPMELARLTGIPDIREVHVLRNPFIRSYSNYRVTIFNLFRKTPGYTEDILIDGAGPSYGERKQLADRVPEAPRLPLINTTRTEDQPPQVSDISIPAPEMSPVVLSQTVPTLGSPSRPSDDYVVSTQKKRKTPRRRIVELSQPGNWSPSRTSSSGTPQSDLRSTGDGDDQSGLDHQRTPPDAATRRPNTLSEGRAATTDAATLTGPPSNSETYRRKIEALRTDFGPSWLSAVGSDSWGTTQQARSMEFRPGVKARATAQGIPSGGRTLG